MKIDLVKLNEQIELGNVNFQDHPSLPLKIYKYSKQAVFSQAWNDITLLCRGLVLDVDGNVVVNCMPKFYNNNQLEGVADYERSKHLPYVVTEKADGSLIQVAKWMGHLIITSSGSFASPQVHMAAEMLLEKYAHYKFEDGLTYVMELIHPSNRIVLDYKDRKSLVMLAIRNTETGEEFPLDRAFECIGTVNMSIEEILKELPREDYINAEGYITKFSNGVRIKWKYSKYCELHKVLSGISEKWCHACLRDKLDYHETAIDIPEELDQWIQDTQAKFKQLFSERLVHVVSLCEEVVLHSADRKTQAQYILSKYKSDSKLLFGLLDGRDISKLIFDEFEPKGNGSGLKWGAGASADEE